MFLCSWCLLAAQWLLIIMNFVLYVSFVEAYAEVYFTYWSALKLFALVSINISVNGRQLTGNSSLFFEITIYFELYNRWYEKMQT